MSDFKHIIEPERMGLWVSAAFIVGLLGLVVAFISMHRLNTATHLNQLQLIQLNQKIESLQKGAVTKPANTEAVAPAK